MAPKKKILILSYFFPPCNLTPSERLLSFARYLPEGGYEPVVITRTWSHPIRNATTDIFLPGGETVEVERNGDYEVHYVPYRQNLRDRLFVNLYGKKAYPLYLVVAFFWNPLQLFFFRMSSCWHLYRYARHFLRQHPEFRLLLVSVAPFELLGMANRLSRRFGLQWMADYRDDWSTNEMQYADSLPKRLLNLLYARIERRWMKSASFFSTVSEPYREKLAAFLHKDGVTVANGFMAPLPEPEPLFPEFTVVYLGSLYGAQPIERFLEGYKQWLDESPRKARLIFVGIGGEPPIRKRVEVALKGYETHFTVTPRLSKNEALRMQQKAHALLAIAYEGKKGIPGSKLYDYIQTKKPVILFPTDGDILESTLSATGQALICSGPEEVRAMLNTLYTRFSEGLADAGVDIPENLYQSFSRAYQCRQMTDAMHRHFTSSSNTPAA